MWSKENHVYSSNSGKNSIINLSDNLQLPGIRYFVEKGKILIPVYNNSNKVVQLKKNKHLASVEGCKTVHDCKEQDFEWKN